MASDLTRIVSDTHRELEEKKAAVEESLKKLHAGDTGQGEEDKEGALPDEQQQDLPADPEVPAPSEALKVFFDRIPLSSIPGLQNGHVVELSSKGCIGEAIKRLYEESVMGAPVFDESSVGSDDDTSSTDRYLGLIEFSSMVLWALQELEKVEIESKKRGFGSSDMDTRFLSGERKITEERGFFKALQQHSSVWETKVAAMARTFRWGAFLPVRPEDTLLQALLMLSKHSLKAVPVINPSNKTVSGFITQDAAIHVLLQCSGLEWFDVIANKKLREFRFEVEDALRDILHVQSDKTVLEALVYLWKHRLSGIPIIEPESKKITGNIRTVDVRILLDSPEVFEKRRSMSLEELLKVEMELNQKSRQEEKDEDMGAAIVSAAALRLKRGWRPHMAEVVTCTSEETLKELMCKLEKAGADRGFLIDSDMHMVGLVTLRDIIIQFAPPLAEFPKILPGFFHT